MPYKIWELYKKAASRLCKRKNGVFKNILYELNSTHLLQVFPKLDVNWVWIDEHNYTKVLVFRKEHIAESFKGMLRTGAKGVFAMYQDRSIAHCWAHIGKNDDLLEINDLISLRQGEAYIHFCHTDQNYRGSNIYPFLLYVLSNHLFEVERVRIIFIDTDIANIPSRKGIKKVGFREKYLVRRLCLLGKTLIKDFHAL